jgi:uncharacterized protein YjbI with pentapeptide repeats/uncharacterized protein YwqG
MTHLIDFDRVVALYDVGGRDFRGVECQGDLINGNLPGIDLSNATLDGLSLDESDFTGANLSQSKITGCSLNATNFTDANLSGVEFSKKSTSNGSYESYSELMISHFDNLDRTNLSQETLSAFNLIEDSIRSTISQGADSIERKEETYVSSLSYLQLAIFERANLSQSDLTEVNLIDANLRFANLAGANLTKADLRGADLTGANLVDANFTGANLCQANLTDAILTETTLSKALVGWTIMPDGSISDSQAMDLIASKFKPFKRTAWKPITVKGDSDLAVSKFAGKPWINPGDSYPMCEYCQTPLRFFLQLNLSQLPESLDRQFGDGLLQLFYCTNSESGCDGGDVFLIKNIQPTEIPLQYEMPDVIFDSRSALIEGEFPAKQIASWQAMDDYPNSYDNQSLIEFLDEFGFDETEFRTIVNTPNINSNERLFKFDEGEFELHANYLNPNDSSQPSVDLKKRMMRVDTAIDFMGLTRMRPLEGDKLSGHPHWHQGEEFPNCPDCDRLMDRLIFEFASDDNIRYLWGDCGTGYILQCAECKDRVTFLHQE